MTGRMTMGMFLSGVHLFNMEGIMLSRIEMIDLGAKLLKASRDEVEKNSGMIDEQTLYISFPVKGGKSLIVSTDGTVLYASSAVGYSRHLEEFKKGRRTPIERFN